MSLTQGFCPKCGAPSENGELCGKCRVKDTVWVDIADRAECIICPTCGSIKTAGIWSDVAVEKEELGQNLVNSVIVFHKDVEDIQKEISIIDTSSNGPLQPSMYLETFTASLSKIPEKSRSSGPANSATDAAGSPEATTKA